MAGVDALVALIVAYRRQKTAEADSVHDRTRVFNERFTAIATQLGDDQPAVRLAGVYAMAGLADDWKQNRQTCVSVLCAHLRLSYDPERGEGAAPAERAATGPVRPPDRIRVVERCVNSASGYETTALIIMRQRR